MFSNDSHNITVGVLYGFTGTWGLDRVSEHISVDGSIYIRHGDDCESKRLDDIAISISETFKKILVPSLHNSFLTPG